MTQFIETSLYLIKMHISHLCLLKHLHTVQVWGIPKVVTHWQCLSNFVFKSHHLNPLLSLLIVFSYSTVCMKKNSIISFTQISKIMAALKYLILCSHWEYILILNVKLVLSRFQSNIVPFFLDYYYFLLPLDTQACQLILHDRN